MTKLHVGGKLAPAHDPRTLRLASFMGAKLPTPPDAVDYSDKCKWPMYANDVLGDCTIAAAAHMEELWGALESQPAKPTTAQVKAAYFALGTEDNGRVMLDVLRYWRKQGIAKRKLAAFAALSLSDPMHVKLAVSMFGGAYVGLNLPLSAQSQVGSMWEAAHAPQGAAGSWGGHAVNLVGYDAHGPICITWGARQQMTWEFWHAYADEAYAPLTAQWLDAKPKAGIDFPALKAALASIGKVAA